MATLISCREKCEHRRQCTAKCYMAKGLKCTCICGGRNHGVGPERAAQNVQALSVEWLNELEAIANRQEIARLKAAASQLSLELY